MNPATCLSWRSEPTGYCCVLRRYRCDLQPLVTTSAPDDFIKGQRITVDGIKGPHAHLNGTYVVDSVNPGTITP
jgi:hypothetical protein